MHALMLVFSMLCLPNTNGKIIQWAQMMFLKNATNTTGGHVSDDDDVSDDDERKLMRRQ